MSRTVCFKVSNGLDSAMRVMATLRRKNFNVTEFSMKNEGDQIVLRVAVDDINNPGFDRAVMHVKRLVDVFDVVEVC